MYSSNVFYLFIQGLYLLYKACYWLYNKNKPWMNRFTTCRKALLQNIVVTSGISCVLGHRENSEFLTLMVLTAMGTFGKRFERVFQKEGGQFEMYNLNLLMHSFSKNSIAFS